eukprot:2562929-Rhodomonas_salina.1
MGATPRADARVPRRTPMEHPGTRRYLPRRALCCARYSNPVGLNRLVLRSWVHGTEVYESASTEVAGDGTVVLM